MGSFDTDLANGQLGESVIAKWLLSRGNCVIPVYEKEIDTGKGPRFFTPEGPFVAPDMLVAPSMRWVEAKQKSVFTWYRKHGRWCTGIDLNHYQEYHRVQEVSGWPVWLLFLHRSSAPHPRDLDAGCPRECPTGLFGGSLTFLMNHEDHRHQGWGRHGMVYWAVRSLQHLASLDELNVEREAA